MVVQMSKYTCQCGIDYVTRDAYVASDCQRFKEHKLAKNVTVPQPVPFSHREAYLREMLYDRFLSFCNAPSFDYCHKICLGPCAWHQAALEAKYFGTPKDMRTF